MPLPENNSPWLPEPWDVAYREYAENAAWWTGDVEGLERIYRREEQSRPDYVRHGQRMRGGVVGRASRFFWGRPIPAEEHRTRLHIPAPADLATLASDLVFAEPPTVSIPKLSERQQDRLDVISNSDGAHATFNRMGELKSALSATALVTRWDTDVEDHVWLDTVAADVMIPTFRSGRMIELTMWTEYRDGNVFWRHLEHHAIGYIEHALYQGTETNLGRRVPLTERTETAVYAKLVNGDSVIPTGINRLTASYNPNMETIAWRKQGVLAHTGRSDFDQLHPLFDALDETWSSWIRDLRLGAGKVLVSEVALDYNGIGKGASFDMGREVFVGLNMPGDPDKLAIDQVQFDIRTEQHEATAAGIYREILRKAGFSPSSWGEYSGGQGAMTATEIDDRKSASERTRDKKILTDRGAIARQSSVALELDGLIFRGKGGGRFAVPDVEFPDQSQESPLVLAQTLSLLDAAGAISTEQKVRRANSDWDDEQVLAEVEKIRNDRPAALDPAQFTGDGLLEDRQE